MSHFIRILALHPYLVGVSFIFLGLLWCSCCLVEGSTWCVFPSHEHTKYFSTITCFLVLWVHFFILKSETLACERYNCSCSSNLGAAIPSREPNISTFERSVWHLIALESESTISKFSFWWPVQNSNCFILC